MLETSKRIVGGSSVALIGTDGSGKTSIANALLKSSRLPLVYLYMGVNVESSNVALPTSKLAHWFKRWQHRRSLKKSGKPVPDQISLHGIEHRKDRRGKIGATLRLFKRISEESYRQLLAWNLQRRGKIVLFDRHFVFDICPPPTDQKKYRLTDRIHHWFLRRCYPRPGLVIFLDAPAEIAFDRKQEVPLDYLEANRQALKERMAYATKFVTVDASQPFEAVLNQVQGLIHQFCTGSE